nr:MAG TPA: hypothetical protein [Caudoviricetes sp.]
MGNIIIFCVIGWLQNIFCQIRKIIPLFII